MRNEVLVPLLTISGLCAAYNFFSRRKSKKDSEIELTIQNPLPSSEDQASVDLFFRQHENLMNLTEPQQKVREFIKYHLENNRPVVLVTSGCTVVPLEQNMVRCISNFSSGTRGARSAEAFIKNNYACIYLHHHSSKMPYDSIVLSARNGLHVKDSTVEVQTGDLEFLKQQIKEYENATTNNLLFEMGYKSLHEYLILVRMIAIELRVLKKNAFFYSAAAVADFYIPWDKLEKHKIQSRDRGQLRLHLDQTPKMLKPFIKEWAPDCFVVSFKLETDENILESKARSAMSSYGMQAVVANLLESHWKKVFLYTNKDVVMLEKKSDERSLEPRIISILVEWQDRKSVV